MKRTLLPWLLAFLCVSVQADPLRGKVYGVFPEGVMVDYGAGSYLVPTQHATFELGGVRASWSNLQPGQVVDVRIPNSRFSDLVRVRDPYQWKLSHHPNHPHGGPPGQVKKKNRKNKGRRNKGRGKKGRGR